MAKQQFLDKEGLNVLVDEIIGETIQSISINAGTNNGTIKLTVNGTVYDNIPVKGLESAAYTSKDAFAAASPSFTQSAALSNIVSGETLSVMLGKISKSLAAFISHKSDAAAHITSDERTNWNSANSQKHTHNNKTVLDKLTQALLDSWNSAYAHVSDSVKHITSSERTKWDAVVNKVDKVAGKQLSTNDYTSADKTKLSGIEENANKYIHPSSDGNKHVPATGTANNGKFLKAGTTTGALSWAKPTKSDVGLSNVDNTSDANKPVSAQQQAALNDKVSASGGDIKDTTVSALNSTSTEFPYPEANQPMESFLGNIRQCLVQTYTFIKDFNDHKAELLTLAKLVNNGSTTAGGYALDARYGKTLYDLYAQLNSNKLSWNFGKDYNPDANNLKESGFYFYDTNYVSNLPTYEADNAFYILVFKYNDSSTIQFYLGFKAGNTIGAFARGNWAGEWRSWVKLG